VPALALAEEPMNLGQVVLLVFAILMLVGGVMGYRAAGSAASLYAGTGSALVLLVAWFVSRTAPAAGFGLGALTSLALCIVFGIRVAKTGKMMPSGMLLVVSAISLIALVYATMRAGKT
jgi:uncharacterized membrane protein (UPF0136 family)